MRKLMWLLAVVSSTASAAFAGPNAGGVLVVHNTGMVWSVNDPPPLPPSTVPPTWCSATVNTAAPGEPVVWKIYAVFPQSSSPRLASTAYGVAINKPGDSGINIQGWGLANPGDWELPDGILWPNGGGIGEAFTAGLRTSTINDLYWFGGYGYLGSGGEAPTFCVQKWEGTGPAIFVSDGIPALEDPIAGWGCLGFGAAGYTPCPAEPGACCTYGGVCTIEMQTTCLSPRIWNGAPDCLPTPCAQPGRCCNRATAECTLVHESDCNVATSDFTPGADCSVACPPPTGSCCLPDYTCEVRLQADCLLNVWVMFGTCQPGSCPTEPMGACCQQNGSCAITGVLHCPAGVFMPGELTCLPNPCPLPDGACCTPYICIVEKQAACLSHAGWTWFPGACLPATCPTPPAQAACCHAGWIQGMQGYCTVELEPDCLAGNPGNVWHPEWIACLPLPTPCPVIPTVEGNWGTIKNIYR
jgi:hypothetical protein